MDPATLHREALVIDSHNDTIVHHIRAGNTSMVCPGAVVDRPGTIAFLAGLPDPYHGAGGAQIDLPKMRAGGIDAGFFAIDVTLALKNRLAYAMDGFGFLFSDLTQHGAELTIVRKADDILAAKALGVPAALLAIEHADGLEGSLNVLRSLYELGVRSIGLTHNISSAAADGCLEARDGVGLTRFGLQLVQEMNRLGMLVDLAHVSPSAFFSALDVVSRPVIFSHGNARALCDHPRNLTDDQLRALQQNGGVIGLSLVPYFVDQQSPSLARWLDHVEHIVEVAGIDSVGLGSDYDGEARCSPMPRRRPRSLRGCWLVAIPKNTYARCWAATRYGCSRLPSDRPGGITLTPIQYLQGKVDMKARAVVFDGPLQVSYREIQVPDPGPDDVVIDVGWSWISPGTESSFLRGERIAGDTPFRLGDPSPFPLVAGYQKTGIVTQVGSRAVGGFAVGERVFATVSRVQGMFSPMGGHVSPAVTPSDQVWRLPPEIDSAASSGLVLAQVGVNCGMRAPIAPGDTVVVLGDGLVGQWSAQTACARGARVVMVGRHLARLALARGCDMVDGRNEDVPAALARMAPEGIHVLVDTVGDLNSVDALLGQMRRDGHIVSAGFYGTKGFIDIQRLRGREITLHAPSGWTRPRMDLTLQMLATGRLDTISLVTHRFPVEQAPEAWERIVHHRDDTLGVILDWAAEGQS
ncbi:MAG: membrane dipeptidase [Anaerolineae bacterium]